MAAFDDLRQQLQKQRLDAAAAGVRAAAARERQARLEVRLRGLSRGEGNHPGGLEQQVAEAKEQSERASRTALDADRLVRAALSSFSELSDPRKAISELDDRFPILMIPVRLETRFRGAQLLVRVYPDDCSIDTFEEMISENEVTAAQLYWSSLWAAGGIENQERGAWRGLAGATGSGRAEWIVTHYQPLNLPAKPAKAAPDDVVLTIATQAPPAGAEQAALAAYWTAFWRADDDQTGVATATAALTAALGGDAARAAALVGAFVPFNLTTRPAPPLVKADIAVATAFVVFPNTDELDVKRFGWTRAATAQLMPDRFVFIGYRNGVEEALAVGLPVASPLAVAPDPSAPAADQLRQDPATGELIFPEDMRWLADFDRAVEVGMGFRVDLTPAQAEGGFDRVLVLGLRASADAATAQKELETLLSHHRLGRSGLSIVSQGTPTNNTEAGSSGYSRVEDPDVSFDELSKDALFTETNDVIDRADGQWLAEALGIDSAVLAKVRHSDGRDQADARAMNIALFPATLGYWMETLMSPVFGDGTVQRTRDFFNRYVSGRGAVPAVRIGRQPYGILPVTAFSRMEWLRGGPRFLGGDDYLFRLYGLLKALLADWRKLTAGVSFAGKSGDPHQLLLDIVGLNSGSVEYAQRVAESAEQIFNRLALDGLGRVFGALVLAGLYQSGRDLLARLGYSGSEDPAMLKKFFLADASAMHGPVVDDAPLSETDPVRPSTADGKQNYLEWLISAAGKSVDVLYKQEGFKGDRPPSALLYLVLRHALQLGYHDTSLRLHASSGLMTADMVRAAKQDDPFIHIREQPKPFESRYEVLYKSEPAITGSPQLTIGEFIGGSLATLVGARSLREQVDALQRLKDAPTARLERAFAEHIDCCTYRLDAWLLGLVRAQLEVMRALPPGQLPDRRPAPPEGERQGPGQKKGLYVGAYAWLEDLKPDKRVPKPVHIPDPAVAKDFAEESAPPLASDSANQGFIHAPSLNHAVAAAVLRNGYIGDGGDANARTLAVNVTSERVRTALGVLEGIRGGQSLGALLGYQFERALHDGHDDFGVELDQFIFKLRREFPLSSNRLASTAVKQDDLAIENVEARNVLDGVALLEHIRKAPAAHKGYKFGIDRLPDATPAQAAAIDAEAERLAEVYDAVADLAMAEGVYEAVLGTFDRVASTLDAYGKATFPPEPLVARTPFDGTGITHRVGLHFALGSATVAPGATPRSLAEPAVNAWLASVLPPLGNVGCVVHFRDQNGNPADVEVLLSQLGVQPIDLLPLLRDDQHEQSLTELDERITRVMAGSARPDGAIEIRYRETKAAALALFQVLPLARHVRRLLGAARPLRSTDIALPNDAKTSDDGDVLVDPQRLQNVVDALTTLEIDLGTFGGELDAPLADPVANRAQILANADDWIDRTAGLLARAAAFGMPQTGWGFTYDYRMRAFSGVLGKAKDLVDRWSARLTDFDALVAQYDALPAATSEEERLAELARAEQLVSTATASPFPATPADYRAELDVRRAAFDARRAAFVGLTSTTRTKVSLLFADAGACLPVDAFEFPALSIAAEQNLMIAFAQDAASTVKVVLAECGRRLADAGAQMALQVASPGARADALAAAAKALLGSDFVIVPEFALPAAKGDGLAAAVAASGSLLDYLTNTVKTEFPVDTWMYGVARARHRIRDWEQIVMLSGALTGSEPELTPVQLPFVLGDRWLALEFPPDTKLDYERLLYTAHFAAPFDKNARQCGLLLDEWNEVIPGPQTTTGLTFHYDRPNNEAPQAMLLVTPTAFRGRWQWNDLVDALNETLDLAKVRAVEPTHVDSTPYAHFLPATVMAMTVRQLTISANLAMNNALREKVPLV